MSCKDFAFFLDKGQCTCKDTYFFIWLHHISVACGAFCCGTQTWLPVACGILALDQGSSPCPLHWKVGSQPQTTTEVQGDVLWLDTGESYHVR